VDHREQTRLRQALAGLSGNERQHLYKQAAKLRQAAQGKQGLGGRRRGSIPDGKLADEEARWYFAEFADLAPGCRFSDCSHLHEPACAIKRAVDRGRISSARYDSYRRIASNLPR
jgi:hypothetical protein